MKNVITLLDRSDKLEQVCDYASWAALKLNAPLELLYVQTDSPHAAHEDSDPPHTHYQATATLAHVDRDSSTLAREQALQLLEQATQRVMAHGIIQLAALQPPGQGIEVLLELEVSTRLYVLGPGDPNPDVTPLVLSPTVDLALRTLNRPMLVARTPFQEPERFVLAFDGSDTGRKIVQRLADSPLMRDLDCHIVTVGQQQEELDWAAERFDEAGFRISTYQLSGDPSHAVSHFAETHAMDILIVGAYGHSGVRPAMIGSTTTAILQHSHMSVLVMR